MVTIFGQVGARGFLWIGWSHMLTKLGWKREEQELDLDCVVHRAVVFVNRLEVPHHLRDATVHILAKRRDASDNTHQSGLQAGMVQETRHDGTSK